jgi:hypothetical protein
MWIILKILIQIQYGHIFVSTIYKIIKIIFHNFDLNQKHCDSIPLAPNDLYMDRTAQLTSRRCILNTYSTNIHTEYFKHAA